MSGTGALRVAGEFLAEQGPAAIYLPGPTWPNHNNIFKRSGLQLKTYPYWNPATKDVNFEGMMQELSDAAPGSIVLLHACAHNPTGCDPTNAQWEELATLIEVKKLYPFFDIAYQGFASGDLDADAFSIRLFAQRGLSMIVAQSFAKNMGLYGERIGALHVRCQTPEIAARVSGQLKQVIRSMYSNPPLHGALIVNQVLGNAELRALWTDELKQVSARIQEMRTSLKSSLESLSCPGTWDHITKQIGMFSYTGLTEAQVAKMEANHCYLMKSGRVSMSGINSGNVGYLAECIKDSVTNA